MATRLTHALLFVRDLEAMADFYAAVFGLRREDSADAGFLHLRATSGAGLALHRIPPEAAGTGESQPPWREDCAVKLCFATDDLGAARRRLLERGGQAREPWSWEGTDYCECADPEGNVLQLSIASA